MLRSYKFKTVRSEKNITKSIINNYINTANKSRRMSGSSNVSGSNSRSNSNKKGKVKVRSIKVTGPANNGSNKTSGGKCSGSVLKARNVGLALHVFDFLKNVLKNEGYTICNSMKMEDSVSDTIKMYLRHKTKGMCFAKISAGRNRAQYKAEERIYREVGKYKGFIPHVQTILLDGYGKLGPNNSNITGSSSNSSGSGRIKKSDFVKTKGIRMLITKVNKQHYPLSVVMKNGGINVRDMILVMRQIFGILKFMESNHIMHNDLHLGNIMYDVVTKKVQVYDWDMGAITTSSGKVRKVRNPNDSSFVKNKYHKNYDFVRFILNFWYYICKYIEYDSPIKENIHAAAQSDSPLLEIIYKYHNSKNYSKADRMWDLIAFISRKGKHTYDQLVSDKDLKQHFGGYFILPDRYLYALDYLTLENFINMFGITKMSEVSNNTKRNITTIHF